MGIDMSKRGYGLGAAPETAALRRFRREVRHGRSDALPQAEVARRLGIGQQAISSILSQKSRPGAHVRLAIEREFGIPSADWMTPEERAIATGRTARSA